MIDIINANSFYYTPHSVSLEIPFPLNHSYILFLLPTICLPFKQTGPEACEIPPNIHAINVTTLKDDIKVGSGRVSKLL